MSVRPRKLALLLLGVVLLVLVGGRMITEVWVELLWYRSLDLERLFWTRWGAGLAVRLAVGLLVGAFVFVNLWVVSRSLGTIRVRRRYANIEIAERLPQSYMVLAVGALSLFSAWWISAAVGDPLSVVAALRRETWGAADPVFGRDISFYVFLLPLLGGAQALAGVLVFWTALLATVAYVATGAIRVQEGTPTLTPLAEKHLGLLLSAFLLILAVDAWLDRYGLLLDGNGIGGAFGYTDQRARLPGLLAVTLMALLAAAATAYSAWEGRRRPAAAAIALLAFTVVAARIVAPSVVQRFSVDPNEFPRERPYIQRHLASTLEAYGLSELTRVRYPYTTGPGTLPAGERLRPVLAGVPLWDPRPLGVVFDQQQSLFPYYDFLSVHLDRYGPPESQAQVAISVRELIPSELPASAQTWQNLRLRYVSGQGAVVSPVAEMAEDGTPTFFLSDMSPPKLAPDAPANLALAEPRVYFSEHSQGYVILEEGTGPRGIQLGGTLKRLALAWAFQSKNIFLADEVTATSRLIFGRAVVDRARAIAPFLHFTSDSPQPIIHEGRIVWMVDAYSTSRSVPLSPLTIFGGAGVRYVRNSAKVTVDAVTGEVEIYAVDTDPILRTYGRVFPGLVRSIDQMDPELRRHLRVPPTLVSMQTELLGEYHLVDPLSFYEKEDVWSVATENYRSETVPVQPTFVILPLPGQESAEFLLVAPFVSRGRQNMTAMLVTRNDGEQYGEQLLYLLPRDVLVPGPQQVESMIDQDPEIAQQLSLWRRGGSEVIRGHLVIVPIDSTLVYVEPLYLEAQNQAIPQLERVIVAHGGRVAMRPTLQEALAALTGPRLSAPAGDGAAVADRERSEAVRRPAVQAEAVERARRLLEQAERQLRAGDWAAFGRTWEQLREALRAAEPSVQGPG